MPSPDSLQLTIKWVLLPNGISADGQDLLFSVYAAPALVGDEQGGFPTLSDFPDLLDWPATVARIDFGIELDGTGQRVSARLLPGPRSTAAWRAIFSPGTTVMPYAAAENLTARPVMTFSAATVLESLRHSYARLVVDSIEDLPLIAPFATTLAGTDQPFADVAAALQQPVMHDLMSGGEAGSGMLRTLLNDARPRAESPTGMVEVLPSGGPADELVRTVAFHTAQQRPPASEPTAEERAADRQALHDSVDFHKIISSLSDHPALLRHLGLVVDLAVARSATDRTSGTVALRPEWDSAFPAAVSRKVDSSVWIAWQLDPTAAISFAVASDQPPGVLDIGRQSPYSVRPLALDSAVLQTVSMVSSLPPGGERSVPPALRSGGLSIIQKDRGQAAHADLDAATQALRGASPDRALRAHDVTRGYRLDVLDADQNVWRSLHARRVTYSKDDAAVIDPVLDEGCHHPSATGPAVAAGGEPGERAPIFLHESFVHWDGWSLSAPRPGRSLGMDPSGPDPDRPETMPQHSSNDPLTQTGLRIETSVRPRSLPRLRFGHRYRLRIRTVDLAGNGLDPAAADALWQRPSVALAGTGQTVSPDGLASAELRFARFEPVPPPTIIQRTPDRSSAHRLVVRSSSDEPALDVEQVECQLFAPKGSIELAEWHGMFDDAIGSGDRAKVRASYDVAARESGVLPDRGADELPYLPDPLAVGVAIAGGPLIVSGGSSPIMWRGDSWDRPRPITLRVMINKDPIQAPLDPDEDESLVEVKLDPARRARLRLSSLIPRDTPFGLLDWLSEDTAGDDIDEDTQIQLRRAIGQSRHPMFTPWEELEVLHAVQKPLKAPDLQPAAEPPVRRPGDTVFVPNCTLRPEPFSTATLTLHAKWTDVVDDPVVRMEPPPAGAAMPWLRDVTTVVGSTDLVEPDLEGGVMTVSERTDLYFKDSTMPPLQFSDTRHREVTCRVTAVSRFGDEFPELAEQPGAFTLDGDPAVVVALSTARPPAPVVADVVPLVSTGPVALSTGTLDRGDGWVRIWLERPWFVTGAGEMLGIVVADQAPAGPADPMYDLVSLAGIDPVHESRSFLRLRPESLLNAVAIERGVELPECRDRFGNPAPTVSVALFAPEFDFTSQRWFADVQVSLEAYFPMVRLAAVRYQPASVAVAPAPDDEVGLSAHHFFVSPVVLLDPIPLFPGRSLTVRKVIKPTHSLLQLELRGPTYIAVSSMAGQRMQKAFALSRVTARPQSRLPIELAAGEPWLNGPEIKLKRDDPSKPWRLHLEDDALRDLGPDVERILIVEEDHVPWESGSDDGPYAPRTIFAAVVEGPFLPSG